MPRLLLPLLGLLLLACRQNPAASQTVDSTPVQVHPQAIDDVLSNPGIGVEMWHRAEWATTPASYPDVRLTYYRWYWSALEPARGRVRWELFERALDDAVATGARMGFRVMTVGGGDRGSTQGREGRMAVPEWLAEAAGGTWYGDVFWPDTNDPVFLQEVERLLTEIGRRYGDHPGLNHVDTGFFGCWGEQNDACIDGGVRAEDRWTPQTYRRALDLHVAAFPDVPILQLGTADPEIGDYAHETLGLGWRVDCFGDYGYFSSTWNHMEDYYPQILSRYGDAWQRGMVSFEICGTLQDWVDKGFDFDRIMDDALAWHASSMNLKAGSVPDTWMPKLRQTLKRMGYRLRVDALAHPTQVAAGDTLAVALTWSNDGVAPPYHRYPLALQLVGGDGGPERRLIVDAVDVRDWLPGTRTVEARWPLDDLGSGDYRLRVALLSPHDGKPAIRLANEGRTDDGWYDLSGLTVVGRP